jgi:histidyl-tRNA synthetase
MRAALQSLGMKDLLFKISHRGLLTGFLEAKKLAKSATLVLRAIDKLDKQGEASVLSELQKTGLSKTDAKDLISFVANSGSTKTTLKTLRGLGIANEAFETAVTDLEMICKLLDAAGFKAADYSIDLSVARGLDYYTGMVFETILKKTPKAGSICGGGRYDNLLSSYRKDPVPGVGASIGLSRLFSALKANLDKGPANPAQALIVPFDPEEAAYCLEVATHLRRAGINTLVYPGFDKAGKQLGYADKLGINAAVLIGSVEAGKKQVTVKNLKTGKQITVSLKQAVAAVRKTL